jgi:hypothetical protein
MCRDDLPMRQRPVKSPALRLGLSSSLELEESSLEKSRSLRAAHARDIIFWNFFLSPKRYFLSSPLSLESNFFLLGQSAMKWVVSPHSKQPLGDLLLSLRNLYKAQNFLTSRAISSSRMLSYCSSEATHKEDKANFKAVESVVLVGLATWPPTRVLVTKVLLVREASWFRHYS